MSGEKAILLSLVMNLDDISTSRNIEEKQLAIDITDNEDFNNINVKLLANNEQGTHTKSQKIIEDVESFFYLYAPYTVEVTFTKEDNTEFTLPAVDITMIRGAFTQIVIKNKNRESAAMIRVIYT